MNTEKKNWISDRMFFGLVVGISLAVPALVVALALLPDEIRPNANFAEQLPFANAVLNSLVSISLIAGYIVIKRTKNKIVHQTFMLTAFVLSAIFLISYVTYHMTMPRTNYCYTDWTKYAYFFILVTHICLAAIILPLVLYTIYFSTTGSIEKHRKLARWTFPLWLYVSITGVVVYVLISQCYQF
jgi:putative membrane protein